MKKLDGFIEGMTLVLGPFAFLLIVIVGLVALKTNWDGFKFADFMTAVATGAAVLAVGQGVHRTARTLRDTNINTGASPGTSDDE